MVFDTATHLAIGAAPAKGTGSGCGPPGGGSCRKPICTVARIKSLLADAGYDSGSESCLCTDGVRRSFADARQTWPVERGKPPAGYWRRQMRMLLSTKTKRRRSGYTQRAQAETGFSMIKRRQGESVAARTFENQCGELRLMVLTHNLMICYLWCGFLQSRTGCFFLSENGVASKVGGWPIKLPIAGCWNCRTSMRCVATPLNGRICV